MLWGFEFEYCLTGFLLGVVCGVLMVEFGMGGEMSVVCLGEDG